MLSLGTSLLIIWIGIPVLIATAASLLQTDATSEPRKELAL